MFLLIIPLQKEEKLNSGTNSKAPNKESNVSSSDEHCNHVFKCKECGVAR